MNQFNLGTQANQWIRGSLMLIVLSISCSGAYASCKKPGLDCTSSSACCSGVCSTQGKCVWRGEDNCKRNGLNCEVNADCCSGYCGEEDGQKTGECHEMQSVGQSGTDAKTKGRETKSLAPAKQHSPAANIFQKKY